MSRLTLREFLKWLFRADDAPFATPTAVPARMTEEQDFSYLVYEPESDALPAAAGQGSPLERVSGMKQSRRVALRRTGAKPAGRKTPASIPLTTSTATVKRARGKRIERSRFE